MNERNDELPPEPPPTVSATLQEIRSSWIRWTVGLLVVAAAVWFITNRLTAPLAAPTSQAAADPATRIRDTEARTADQVQNEARVAARDRLIELRDAATDAITELDTVAQERARWEAEVPPLLHNEVGHFLAGDEAALKAFERLYAHELPEALNVDATRTRIQEIVQYLDQRLADPLATNSPDQTFAQNVSNYRSTAKAAVAAWRERREQIRALAERAQRAGKRSVADLERALQELCALEAVARAASIDERLAAARKQQDEKTAAVEEKLLKENAERERLQKFAADPSIQAQFRPFLDKALFIMNWEKDIRYEKPQPASLNDLTNMGCLTSFEQFLRAATGKWRSQSNNNCIHNDRSKWSWPANDPERQECEKRWALFKDLAPLWVEMGLLAK